MGLLHQEMLSLATMEFSQSLTGEQSELKAQLASKEQEVRTRRACSLCAHLCV